MNSQAENPISSALMQRDAVMLLLIAQSQGLIQRLALLAGSEKTAVAGLVTVGQAMVAYARAAQPDPEVMASFDRALAALSPSLAGHSSGPCALQACLEESTAYAGALAACLRAGKSRKQCEREALAEAAAETACITRNLKELLAAIAPPADAPQRKAGASRSLPSHR
jgi:hypothetical protein